SAFNEAFATAVEEAGVARFAALQPDDTLLQRWQQRRRLRVEITGLITAARADLQRLYARAAAPEAMRESKAARLAELAAAIRGLEQREGRSSGYGSWIDAGLNNAHLASVATYYDQVPFFENMLKDTCGNYLPCLYTKAGQLVAERRAGSGRAHRADGEN